ncbi:hypothetical protein PybrP1_011999 [[Pythium] brassicae (nom. inval.)]|nr:hypothetical protein PybrP1_011999 [[Pythium] brassicae (nom. inval.)]
MADSTAPAAPPSSSDGGDSSASVWVPHDERVWMRAVVLRKLDDGQRAEVRLQAAGDDGADYHKDDGLVKVVNIRDISRLAGEMSDQAMPICNTFTPSGVHDMCTLNHLHEPAVLRNLELRFAQRMPYTYTGQICIAVNPYQWLDLYGPNLYRQYLEQPRESLDPHPFALSASSRKRELRLDGDEASYKYVRAGAHAELTGIDDDQCLKETQEAMDIIGITTAEQNAIFEIVAAILNLGEAHFVQSGSEEKCHVENAEIVENVAHLVRTDVGALSSVLLERSITAGSESYTIPLNSEQATDLRDALAKGIYTQLFDWLVARVNKAICSTRSKSKFNQITFTIRHYAGDVAYNGTGFLEKNKDTLPTDMAQLLQGSSSKEIADIFTPQEPVTERKNGSAARAVRGKQGRQQKGFLELLPEAAASTKNNKFAVGKTKVYFSSGLLQKLEDRRNAILKDHAIMIQKTIRGHTLRKRFVALRLATVKVQAFSRAGFAKIRYQKLRAGVIKIQARTRGRKQRVVFAALVIRVRQEREELARKLARERELEMARESERERQRAHEEALALERERLQRQKEMEALADPQPEPVEDDWSDGSDKEDQGPVSPRTLRALTEAAGKVAEAESLARDAKMAAETALELNRELVAQNDRLRATLSSNVAEYADAELLRENERLKQQVLQLQTKLVRSQEVSLISARVVDSRITYREGRQFVEYKLQIETNTRGTLYVWHRYSTFRNLAATLQTKNGYKRKEIPELPNKQLFGNFSEKIIQERVAKLNQFLEAATNAEYLQWGIRVDQDTCVYKRRVKSASSSRDSIASSASTANSSPRASSRLSMKSFSFRRNSNAGN